LHVIGNGKNGPNATQTQPELWKKVNLQMTHKQALTDAPEERLWLYAPALRDGDTEYIRADIHAAVEAERDALREVMNAAATIAADYDEGHDDCDECRVARQINSAIRSLIAPTKPPLRG